MIFCRYRLTFSLLLFTFSMRLHAQYIIEENLYQNANADTVLFPKAFVKANKIRKCIKTTYDYGNEKRKGKKQLEEIYSYTPDGLIEFYSHRRGFLNRIFGSSYAISIKYDKQNHAIEYHEYKGLKVKPSKCYRSIYSPRLETDTGTLIETRIFQNGDTGHYTFLINQSDPDHQRKVYGARYIPDDKFEDRYIEINTDTSAVFYGFDFKGNIDSSRKATYNCSYNIDSTIQTCGCKGGISFSYGFELPPDITRWYQYITYMGNTSKTKLIVKEQIANRDIFYFNGRFPVEKLYPVWERYEAQIPILATTYKVHYGMQKEEFIPKSQIYFKRVEDSGLHFDVPDKITFYSYEFYP